MVQHVRVLLVDDLDGASEAAGTVRFALDGVQYEIDLTVEHNTDLHDALKPYVQAGRRLGRAAAGGPRRRSSGAAGSISAASAAQIREWAAANNIECNDRGRVPQRVVDLYRDANR